MEGTITITDKRGGIILIANIWVAVFLQGLAERVGFLAKDVRIYIDGQEIDRPEAFKDDT